MHKKCHEQGCMTSIILNPANQRLINVNTSMTVTCLFDMPPTCGRLQAASPHFGDCTFHAVMPDKTTVITDCTRTSNLQ